MDIVKKIIRDKDFYYIRDDRLFDDHFTGLQFCIIAKDRNFISNDPRFADAVVMSPEQFEPVAEAVNDYKKFTILQRF